MYTKVIIVGVIAAVVVGFIGQFAYSEHKSVVQLQKQVAVLTEQASSTDAMLLPLNTLGHEIINTSLGGNMASSSDFISALYIGFNQISQHLQETQNQPQSPQQLVK